MIEEIVWHSVEVEPRVAGRYLIKQKEKAVSVAYFFPQETAFNLFKWNQPGIEYWAEFPVGPRVE